MTKLEPTEAQRNTMIEEIWGALDFQSISKVEVALDRAIAAANSIPEGPPVGTIARRPDGGVVGVRSLAYNGTPFWNYNYVDPGTGSFTVRDDDADSWPVIYDPREDEAPRLAEAAAKPSPFYDAHGMRGSGIVVAADSNQFTVNASDPTAQQEPEACESCLGSGLGLGAVLGGFLETDCSDCDATGEAQPEPEAFSRFPGIENPTTSDYIGAAVADEQLKLVFALRDVRKERGMEIAEVAEAADVLASEISMFESGSSNPTLALVRRYAKAVGAVFTVDVRKWEDTQPQREPALRERFPEQASACVADPELAEVDNEPLPSGSLITSKPRTPRVVDRLGVDEQGSGWLDANGKQWAWSPYLGRWGYFRHVENGSVWVLGDQDLHGPFREILEPTDF